jgi:hypothetical protein
MIQYHPPMIRRLDGRSDRATLSLSLSHSSTINGSGWLGELHWRADGVGGDEALGAAVCMSALCQVRYIQYGPSGRPIRLQFSAVRRNGHSSD